MTCFKKSLAEANCTLTAPGSLSSALGSCIPLHSPPFIYLCMCTHRHTSECMCKSEANLHGLGDGIQTLRLGVKYPYPMSLPHDLELNLISTQSQVLVWKEHISVHLSPLQLPNSVGHQN